MTLDIQYCIHTHGSGTPKSCGVQSTPMEHEIVHSGQCHCGSVAFEVKAPPDLLVWNCNCSICSLKKNDHFIVPSSRFVLTRGSEALITYTFNTGVAQHKFCKICGVQAFYNPRSNPDGVAVTLACVTSATISSVITKFYDGKNWELAHVSTGISACSKES